MCGAEKFRPCEAASRFTGCPARTVPRLAQGDGSRCNTLGLMVRRRAMAGAACVHLAAMRAVSNHGSKFKLVAILRDALASLGLLRMRSEVVERFASSFAETDDGKAAQNRPSIRLVAR